MQSLSGRVVSALLCAVFHSPLINNSELSNNAGNIKLKDVIISARLLEKR